jgi:hypothetical protein
MTRTLPTARGEELRRRIVPTITTSCNKCSAFGRWLYRKSAALKFRFAQCTGVRHTRSVREASNTGTGTVLLRDVVLRSPVNEVLIAQAIEIYRMHYDDQGYTFTSIKARQAHGICMHHAARFHRKAEKRFKNGQWNTSWKAIGIDRLKESTRTFFQRCSVCQSSVHHSILRMLPRYFTFA